MVDSYGAWARHGGGCFSGKDGTKVDRSGAYATRYVAKNLVAMGLCDECEVGVAYVIGRAEPVAVQIETFGTARTSEKVMKEAAFSILNFKVNDILEKLELRRPVFKETASYGHFGRNGFTWEEITG
jgi:S-adenosylmethionine synthetase